MKSSLISIIIPVYNVEKFLDKCISSIINQTYKNIEILLVNDGSIDNSGKICDKYVKVDERVKVIHSKNFGVSHARNLGLNSIKGDYFIFIDSDDYIKKNMIENLYNNIIKYDADVSICNVVKVNENGKIIYLPKITEKVEKISKEIFAKYLYNDDYINGYPVNKLIKTSCLENVRFDERIKHLEDWDFLCRLTSNISNAVHDGRDYYYFYVDRNNSAVHNKFNEAWATDLLAREKNIKMVDLYDQHDKEKFYFDYVIIALNTLGLYSYENKLTFEKKKELLEIKDKYYKIVQKSKYISNKEKIKLFIKSKFPIFYFKLMMCFK